MAHGLKDKEAEGDEESAEDHEERLKCSSKSEL
jgi:hypothetical protein